MMNATLTAALDTVQLSAEERAARLHRLHFVAAASFKALNDSGGAVVTAMLNAWPSYWNAVQAVAPAGALPVLACMPSAMPCMREQVSGSTSGCNTAVLACCVLGRTRPQCLSEHSGRQDRDWGAADASCSSMWQVQGRKRRHCHP